MTGGLQYSYSHTYIDSLVALKRYDEIESFLREDADSSFMGSSLQVHAWRAIAQLKYKDGDKASAAKAIQSAIDSAGRDDGWRGAVELQVEIAMDIKYLFSDKPGRSPAEIVDEVLKTMGKQEAWREF